MGLREFLLGKIGRKLILVFLIISLIPIILFGVILFSIIVPSAGRVVLDVDVGLEQVLHDSREIEVGLLTNSIEERLTEYLSLFQLTIFDKEFYEVLREAGDTGRISDNNFYPAEKI